jgi:hypothetical protein
MTERPILFSGPMVRALLDGRKTQTRRIVKPQPAPCDHGRNFNPGTPAEGPWNGKDGWHCATCGNGVRGQEHDFTGFPCPYGQPGDTLWVREGHAIVPRSAYARSDGVQQTLRPDDNHDACVYREGWERSRPGQWRPSIHMPRWASRLTLTVSDVRVERLQDISDIDAEAEGIREPSLGEEVWLGFLGYPRATMPAKSAYAELWARINGWDSWSANPWVWAVTFEVQARP